MYMPNVRNLRLGPNATYIPNANFRFGVRGKANFCVFRYQHVGIPNAKLWCWGSKPTPGPNANGFASQWNIGLRAFFILFHHVIDKMYVYFGELLL